MPIQRRMNMTEMHPHGSARSRWSLALVSLGAALTVAIVAFVAAVEVTLRAGNARPAAGGRGHRRGPARRPRTLAVAPLAWCIGLAAFGAFYLSLTSAPNYGDLLPLR